MVLRGQGSFGIAVSGHLQNKENCGMISYLFHSSHSMTVLTKKRTQQSRVGSENCWEVPVAPKAVYLGVV